LAEFRGRRHHQISSEAGELDLKDVCVLPRVTRLSFDPSPACRPLFLLDGISPVVGQWKPSRTMRVSYASHRNRVRRDRGEASSSAPVVGVTEYCRVMKSPNSNISASDYGSCLVSEQYSLTRFEGSRHGKGS
jgi:hypothetical protein